MAKAMKLKSDGRTITVRVPISIQKRGGRKVVLAPDGTAAYVSSSAAHQNIADALAKAVARAFRWRYLLESGTYATIRELARSEQINSSYVSRILRLTLLSPSIVESIIEGRHPGTVTLDTLMRNSVLIWRKQDIEFKLAKTRP